LDQKSAQLTLIVIVASGKLYSKQANLGQGIQIWSHERPPGREGVTWPTVRN